MKEKEKANQKIAKVNKEFQREMILFCLILAIFITGMILIILTL